MEPSPQNEKTIAEMLARALVEIVDNNAHLMTVLDLQARMLSKIESREHDEVVAEINEMLKARRREALCEADAWAFGSSRLFEDDES
jgi:hypothetical protein